jgi:hypothetical protein
MSEEENSYFDKFMKEIVDSEKKKQVYDEAIEDESPNRKYAKRYRELPQNKIIFNK